MRPSVSNENGKLTFSWQNFNKNLLYTLEERRELGSERGKVAFSDRALLFGRTFDDIDDYGIREGQ